MALEAGTGIRHHHPSGILAVAMAALWTIPVAVAASFVHWAPGWRWEYLPAHAVIEAFNALVAIVLAAMILSLRHRSRLVPFHLWAATAFMSMGLLKGIHCLLAPGDAFVWTHGMAILAGGMAFAGVWLPARVTRSEPADAIPFIVGGGAFLIGLFGALFPFSLPVMVEAGSFTYPIRLFSAAGGAGFLAATAYLALRGQMLARDDALVFAVHAVLFASSAAMLPFSALWNAVWWLWHGTQAIAFLVPFAYFLLVQRRNENELWQLKNGLEIMIEERTLQLRAEIEERRYMEKALVQNELRLHHLLTASPTVLYTCEAQSPYAVTYISANVADLLGWTSSELIENPLFWAAHVHADDSPALFEDLETLEARGRVAHDYRFRGRDGTYRWLHDERNLVRDPDSGDHEVVGSWIDITDRIKAEAALRESERTKLAILDAAGDSILMLAPDGTCLAINRTGAARMGGTAGNFIGRNVFDLLPFPLRETRRAHVEEVVRSGQAINFVDEREGMVFDHALHPVFSEDGRVWAIAVFARDITARRRAEQRAEELATFPQQNPNPVLRLDANGRLLYANVASAPLLTNWGCTIGGIVPDDVRRLIPKDHAGIPANEIEYPCGEHTYALLLVPGPQERQFNLYGRDATERKRAEVELMVSERRYRDLAVWSIQGIVIHRDFMPLFVNQAFARIHGFDDPDEILRMETLTALIAPRERDLLVAQERERLGGRYAPSAFEHSALRRGGEAISLETLARVVTWEGTAAIQWTVLDVTERKRAVEALRHSEASLANAQRIAKLGSWEWDIASGDIRWSEETGRIFGLPREEFTTTYQNFLERVHPEDRAALEEAVAHSIATETPYSFEHRILLPNGTERVVLEQAEVVQEKGVAMRMSGTVLDITERKRAEADLAQAQKMEAIGQLTGGIAHDFNNILTIIKGNLELLQDLTGEIGDSSLRDIVDDALTAAQQGTHLTSGLLALARRETTKPLPVDVNAAAERMAKLLRRTLHTHIEIRTELAEGLPAALCDERHLEMALLNLALNSRDAMPDGGVLTLASRKAPMSSLDEKRTDGECVAISVRDTGIGMPPEILARMFEPLFTTKARGKGTGLGLRMVDQFANQSGGRVMVLSTPGEGTVVTLFLPPGGCHQTVEAAAVPAARQPTGSGTILLVDDDPKIRRFARRCMEDLGYGVIEAESAEEALALFDHTVAIEGLFSDILMPGGRSGIDLASTVRPRRPGLRIVLASGSPEALGEAREVMGPSVSVLQKPFSKSDIANALRSTEKGN